MSWITCTLSIIIGLLAALFQFTGFVTVSAPFLWVMFGYGVLYLAALVLTGQQGVPLGLLITILCTALTALVLLVLGVTAAGAGLLLLFFTLTLSTSAHWVRQQYS